MVLRFNGVKERVEDLAKAASRLVAPDQPGCHGTRKPIALDTHPCVENDCSKSSEDLEFGLGIYGARGLLGPDMVRCGIE